MFEFTIDGIKRLGEYDQKYGQRYWATTPDGDLPLMFNSMDADFNHHIENGPITIVAEEKSERESNKGTAYLSLRKVKLVEGAVGSARDLSPGAFQLPNPQLDRIEGKLDEILAFIIPGDIND